LDSWTYNQYSSIVEKHLHRICDFTDAPDRQTFTILRHDIEFSTESALSLAYFDSEIGAESSFFFQVASESYNLASIKNLKNFQHIVDLGAHVGAHVLIPDMSEQSEDYMTEQISRQTYLMEQMTETKIDRFSIHRPTRHFLNIRRDHFPSQDGESLINAYGPSFFDLTEDYSSAEIRYIADSRHRWDYGHPLDVISADKVQLLLHPEEWSETGLSRRQTIAALSAEKARLVVEDILEQQTVEG